MADISKIEIENVSYDIKDVTARNTIAPINTWYNRETNRKILFIGDSYLEMYNGTTGVIDKFKTLTGITNVIYALKSGTGFDYTVGGENFNTLLNGVTSDNDVTDIIVLGGYNDQYSNQGNVLTAIGTFCTNAKTKFPNAQVYIGMIGFTLETNKRYPIFEVYQTYSKCNQFNAIYLNGVECVMHDTNYFIGGADLTHPNENGRTKIAQAVNQAWKNGYYAFNYGFCNLPITPSGDATSYNNFNINAMIVNNTTYIEIQHIGEIHFSGHPSYSDIHTVAIEIGTLTMNTNDAIFSPWPYNMYILPVTCAVEDASGYRTMNGKLKFVNNKIELTFEDVETSNWTDINNLVYIEINEAYGTFPTQMC